MRLGTRVIVKNRLRAAGRRILGSELDTIGQIVRRDARCHTFFRAIEFIDFQGIGDTTAPDYQGRERRRAQSHLAEKTPAQG